MAPIHVQRLGPQRTDLEPWFLGRWGGRLYATNAIFNGIYNTQPKLFRMAAAQFWRNLAVVLGSCPEPEMVQNGTETDHLEHSGGLVPEYLKWYQHWQFGASGDHGSNICIEIGTPANCRRAGGGLYVWETAFTVQRALCTFGVKVTPCRRAAPAI